jgi:hypothetical protein
LVHSGDLEKIYTTIKAVMEINGETLAEIPLGEDDVRLGYFYRIYDGETRNVKATLEVTELLGDDRAVGTVLHANNDLPPIAVGDRALYIRDISTLFDARTATNEARRAADLLTAEQEATREEFIALRVSYQEQLDRLHDEHEQRLARAVVAHETEINLLNQRLDAERARRDQERAADLAALNANFEKRVASEVKNRERLSRQHVKEITAERDRLRLNIDRLLKNSKAQEDEINRIVQERQTQHEQHRVVITAELETRLVLEERIRVLEAALRGESTHTRPILPNDLGREETVLEHLQRLQSENVKLSTTVGILERHNKDLTDTSAQLAQEHQQISLELAQLRNDNDAMTEATANADEQAETLEELEQSYKTLQIAHLIAERNFYQVAKQIISLDVDDPRVLELRNDLYHRLEMMQANPAPDRQ